VGVLLDMMFVRLSQVLVEDF